MPRADILQVPWWLGAEGIENAVLVGLEGKTRRRCRRSLGCRRLSGGFRGSRRQHHVGSLLPRHVVKQGQVLPCQPHPLELVFAAVAVAVAVAADLPFLQPRGWKDLLLLSRVGFSGRGVFTLGRLGLLHNIYKSLVVGPEGTRVVLPRRLPLFVRPPRPTVCSPPAVWIAPLRMSQHLLGSAVREMSMARCEKGLHYPPSAVVLEASHSAPRALCQHI